MLDWQRSWTDDSHALKDSLRSGLPVGLSCRLHQSCISYLALPTPFEITTSSEAPALCSASLRISVGKICSKYGHLRTYSLIFGVPYCEGPGCPRLGSSPAVFLKLCRILRFLLPLVFELPALYWGCFMELCDWWVAEVLVWYNVLATWITSLEQFRSLAFWAWLMAGVQEACQMTWIGECTNWSLQSDVPSCLQGKMLTAEAVLNMVLILFSKLCQCLPFMTDTCVCLNCAQGIFD